MGYNYCCVNGCKNNSRIKSLFFFSMPKDRERLKSWLKVIGREDLINKKPSTSNRVCSLHFEASMLINRRLNQNAIPSLHILNSDPLNIPGTNEVTKEQGIQVNFTTEDIITNKTKDIATYTESKAVQTDSQCFCKSISEIIPTKACSITNSRFPSSEYNPNTSEFKFACKPEKTFAASSEEIAIEPKCERLEFAVKKETVTPDIIITTDISKSDIDFKDQIINFED